ncbi:hypothetical protein Poli38472_003731 [Pythium oligandrum]|uniref:Cyclic nucleotide-binding domain-containing protein n=1 Tax=Pythium oligandrum TaxID=41045 RepID=A0A8K1CNP5_PYTOL|nr:hypothetical protein Poli38472_003731 [Pythium oligandrum]|eukprot:TMW65966.1 hypothetical protein Poli38472_003731 [Pythium oligandrum]
MSVSFAAPSVELNPGDVPVGNTRPPSPHKAAAQSHWTKTLSADNATTKLGARFHLRKLFLRNGVDTLSHSELEFIVLYLIHETTVGEQPWWAALSHYERLEVANRLQLQHVARDEHHTLWFTSLETKKDCILLYGAAEAKPNDLMKAPVLKFLEGSVIGNMAPPGPFRKSSSQNALHASDHDTLSRPDLSSVMWRRVKREQAFRNGQQHYSKVVINGPADYFLVTTSDIFETTARAADRLQRDQLLREYGLERFLGSVRKKTFESGAILAQEDVQLDALYFIVEGECRATVQVADLVDPDENPFAETRQSSAAAKVLLNGHQPRSALPPQLPIATLGPRALIGDISMLLRLREPTTIQAVTTVTVLALSYEDYVKDCGDLRDPVAAAPIESMKKVAYDTLGFVLDRVKVESEYEHCDQSKKVLALEKSLRVKKKEIDKLRSVQMHQSMLLRPVHKGHKAGMKKDPSSTSLKLKPTTDLVAPSTTPSIPLVVQRHFESSRHSPPLQVALGPLVTKKRVQKGPTDQVDTAFTLQLTREQRKAALALTGIHSPLNSKSLGFHDQLHAPRAPSREEDIDSPDEDTSMSLHQKKPPNAQDECQLFLFPTMTRQRQLHGRSLPMLPKFQGYG